MLDREIGLAGPEPEVTAQIPAVGEARVERKRPVDQPNHGADVFAEQGQHEGSIGEDARIARSRFERVPDRIYGFAAA